MKGIELGFDGSPEGLELGGLGQIADTILTDGSAYFHCSDIEIGGEYVDSSAVSGDCTNEVGFRTR